MSGRTLIRGGCVLTLGARTPNHAMADVLIEGERIAEVGPGLRARDAEVVDATGCIVMPGLVDAHRHLWTTLLRNGGAGAAPMAGLADAYGRHYRPDDLHAATLLGLLAAVETGITTVVDWCDLLPDPALLAAVRRAHADAGVRTVLVAPDTALPDLEAPGGLHGTAFASPDPAATDPEALARAWSAARAAGLRIHAHVGTGPADRGVAARLGEQGLLDADVTLVHGTTLGDDDLDAIAAHGAAIALTPASEMAAGVGTPPVQGLIDRAIRPALGIGDELLAPGDLFSQMRAVQSVQHATHFDLKLAGKGGLPNLLTTREVIRYATSAGARAVGLDGATGSLEPGKQADVLVLRADRPNVHPVNDAIGAVVWGMEPSNVDWVFVAGRARVREGVLDADVARVRERAIAAHRHVAGAADGRVDAGVGGSR